MNATEAPDLLSALKAAQRELRIIYTIATKDGNPFGLSDCTITNIGAVLNHDIHRAIAEAEGRV